jgi:DNA-binding NarL/FixJ family response regulator
LDADTLAEEAAQLFSAMGADGSAELVSASSRNRPPARRPRFGFDALTATERKVVGLIADGLSNVEIAKRLYVSRRTVESHVSAAYRKLEVSSRVELARVVLSRGA